MVPWETSTTFDITALVQYGVLGVVLVLVLLGYLWAKPSVDRILADKTKAEEQRDALLDIYQTQVIPVLNDVKDHVVPSINLVLANQSHILTSLDGITRDIEGIAKEVERRAK